MTRPPHPLVFVFKALGEALERELDRQDRSEDSASLEARLAKFREVVVADSDLTAPEGLST